MSKKEREEISQLPEKYRPLGPWGYWGWTIIYSFPIVGFIFMIINSFRTSNIARRNHARSFFCTYVVILILVLVTVAILYFTGVFEMALNYLDEMLKM